MAHPAEGVLERSEDLRPTAAVLLAGTAAIAALSFGFLALPWAVASTILGALMVAGAEVDARTHLLPDLVTGGAVAMGLIAAAALNPSDPLFATVAAAGRAAGAAAALTALRWLYFNLRGDEGIGLGDVKLVAGMGAWLTADALPICMLLAAAAALLGVFVAKLAGRAIDRTTCIPFGAFLCPSLWLIFFGTAVLGG